MLFYLLKNKKLMTLWINSLLETFKKFYRFFITNWIYWNFRATCGYINRFFSLKILFQLLSGSTIVFPRLTDSDSIAKSIIIGIDLSLIVPRIEYLAIPTEYINDIAIIKTNNGEPIFCHLIQRNIEVEINRQILP